MGNGELNTYGGSMGKEFGGDVTGIVQSTEYGGSLLCLSRAGTPEERVVRSTYLWSKEGGMYRLRVNESVKLEVVQKGVER